MRKKKLTHLRFEEIDFGGSTTNVGTVRMHRAGVRLANASAAGQTLSLKVRQSTICLLVAVDGRSEGKTVERLVPDGADVAGVVGVGPLTTASISRIPAYI